MASLSIRRMIAGRELTEGNQRSSFTEVPFTNEAPEGFRLPLA